MANNVIGVFDSATIADQVVNDLTASGFSSSDINQYQGSSSDLEDQLQSAGISADDARDYATNVGQAGALVMVRADDARTDEAVEIMNRYYTESERTHYGGDTAGYDADTATTGSETSYQAGSTGINTGGSDEARLAVAEEQINIGKREVSRGGVRVRSVVSETPVEEQVTLRDESIQVDRHAVDRPVTDADTNVFKDETIEFTETDEEAVVSKDARVVEEVVIGKTAEQRTETVRDTVRRADVEVEEGDKR
jgi:uncharacterized protein (TIGR02271 family)